MQQQQNDLMLHNLHHNFNNFVTYLTFKSAIHFHNHLNHNATEMKILQGKKKWFLF